MIFIPVDKMKELREAARNGDERAKKIIIMQMNGEDFDSSLDEFFVKVNESPVEEGDDITDEKLKNFLEYNGVKKGDIDYEETIETYYKEFPKARPVFEAKATGGNDIVLPNNTDDNYSIYDEEDKVIEDEEQVKENKSFLDELIKSEYEITAKYNNAILEVSKIDLNNAAQKGIITDLEDIRKNSFANIEKLKSIQKTIIKKEIIE